MGCPNWLDFSEGEGIWLYFSEGIELILLSCGWSKLTRFLNAAPRSRVLVRSFKLTCVIQAFCFGSYWLDSSVGYRTRLDSSLEWNRIACCVVCWKGLYFVVVGPQWFRFQCICSIRLDFTGRIEQYWGVSLGDRNRHDIRVGIIIDLNSVMMKLTWCLCGGLKLSWFQRLGRTWIVFCAGLKISPVLCAGREFLVLNFKIEIGLGVSVGVDIGLVLVCGTKTTS